jgi:hypothetical protein
MMERQPMSDTSPAALRSFAHILYPTDLGADSEAAFVHGLKLALAGKGHFYIVHAGSVRAPDDADWSAFPEVRGHAHPLGAARAGCAHRRRGGKARALGGEGQCR